MSVPPGTPPTDSPGGAPPPGGEPSAPGGSPPPSQNWFDGLPEEFRTAPAITKFKDVAGIAKGYLELEKKIGSQLRVPSEDAKPEEWEAFHKTLGRPDRPEDYKANVPDDVPLEEGAAKRLAYHAWKLGLSPRQYQELINGYAEDVKADQRALLKHAKDTESKLRDEWGGNFERNAAIIERALGNVDPDGSLRADLEGTGMMYHPGLLKMVLALGKAMVADNLISGAVEGVPTKDAALQRIKAIQSDMNHPYHRSRPGDPVHDEVTRLFQLAYD